MTDFKDDKSSSNASSSFKDRILRELEEAAQKRAEEERQVEALKRQKALEEKALRAGALREAKSLEQGSSNEKTRQLAEEAHIQQEEKQLPQGIDDGGEDKETVLSENLKESDTSQGKATDKSASESLVSNVQISAYSSSMPHSLNQTTHSIAKESSQASSSSAVNESEATTLSSEHQIDSSSAISSSSITPTASSSAKDNGQSDANLSLEDRNEAVVAQPEAKEITDRTSLNMTRRKKNHRIAAKITGILVTVIVVVGLLTAFLGYRYVSSALGPVDSNSKQFVTVEIPAGSGNKLVGQILEQNGLIKNAAIFNYYTRFKNVSDLQSGYYNLQKSMTVKDIIDVLQQGGTSEPQEPVSGKILITEGYTIDQIAKAITRNVNTKKVSKTPYSENDFLELMKDKDFIAQMVKKYPKLLANIPAADKARYQLEGYLFPATYNYYEGSTLKDLVDQMLLTMDTNLSPYYDQIAASGRSVNETLTLASLVEKEGSTDDDRRQIASVFYNRLNAQMPLQSNIAVLYAMGKLGQSTTLKEDTTIDTKIKSPYNIYENLGLMPGPVDSPSLSAIEATVNPADTTNLYFVADVTTGNVYYAEDYTTHEANVAKYVNAHLTSSDNSSE